jgi:sulfotransferase
MNKGFYDFIEIGTSNFDTFIEKVDNTVRGISIEPLAFYLDQLPNRENITKINAALSDKDGIADIYYIDPVKIQELELPGFISGSNSINQPHQFTINVIGQELYDSLISIKKVPTITWNTLINSYGIQGIGYLKIDTEGHDHVVLEGYLKACDGNPNLLAHTIECEYDKLLSNIKELDKVLLKLEKYYKVIKGKNDCIMVTKQTVYYQSSLPRAGSTLLQNIIGQNPSFHVTPTSGMIDLMLGARIGYNQNQEAKAGDKEMWKSGFYSFCREGINGYIANLTDKPCILDKNRNWASSYPLLTNIFPDPKIVFMVRDLRAIFASMEKKFRGNPDIENGIVNNMNLTGLTTQQRVEMWAQSHPIGHALPKLNQAILDRTAEKFLFIRYENLCTNPESQLKSIYSYFNLPYFEHNFDYIPQITIEDDTVHGIYGDHTIRNTLGMLPDDSKEILGDYTYEWIYQNFKWYFDIFEYKK